jgi:hypothetical protein
MMPIPEFKKSDTAAADPVLLGIAPGACLRACRLSLVAWQRRQRENASRH